MLPGTARPLEQPLRLRRRRVDLRTVTAGLLILGLMTASSVVSADALHQLPDIWQTIKARPGAEPFRADFDEPPHLPASTSPACETPMSEPAFPVSREDGPLPSQILLEPGGEPAELLHSAIRTDETGAVPRTYQLIVGAEGRCEGRIVTLHPDGTGPAPLGSTRVFVTRQGQLAATALTDDDGRFTVSGLTTGTHALIVSGQDSLLACGFHILQINEPTDADHPIDFTLVSSAITGDDVPAALRRVPTRPPDASSANLESADRRQLDDNSAVRQSGRPATPLRTHPVRQQSDGSLSGRVVQLHPHSGRPLIPPTTEVVLMQAGDVVVSGLTDEHGRFTIHDVEPGIYALVAATIATDERMAAADHSTDDDATQPVSVRHDPAGWPGFATFAVEVVSSIALISDAGNDPQPPPASLDFALMDAADLWSFTGLYSSASQRQSTAARSTLPPSGSKSASSSARPAAQRQAPVHNNPPAGGGGSGVSIAFPFLPPDNNNQSTMSPRSI